MTNNDALVEEAKTEYAADGVVSLVTMVALAEAGFIVDEVVFHFEEEEKGYG